MLGQASHGLFTNSATLFVIGSWYLSMHYLHIKPEMHMLICSEAKHGCQNLCSTMSNDL